MKLIALFLIVECSFLVLNNNIVKKYEKLGRKIQKLRRATGLSQEKFAESINISRTHMGHIEQGVKKPSWKLIGKIAKAFKMKVKDLIPF